MSHLWLSLTIWYLLITISFDSAAFFTEVTILDIRRFTPLSIIYLEAIERGAEEAGIGLVTYRADSC